MTVEVYRIKAHILDANGRGFTPEEAEKRVEVVKNTLAFNSVTSSHGVIYANDDFYVYSGTPASLADKLYNAVKPCRVFLSAWSVSYSRHPEEIRGVSLQCENPMKISGPTTDIPTPRS